MDHYPVVQNSKRNTVDPLLFRFLYGTGVRLSESLNLRICDIRTDEAYALIRGAKNNKDRIVPLAPSLMERLSVYMQGFHRFSEPDAYLFPGKNGRMDCSTAYNHFRDYLLMADIPHTGNGPRIHDFRHGLAVACLKNGLWLGKTSPTCFLTLRLIWGIRISGRHSTISVLPQSFIRRSSG